MYVCACEIVGKVKMKERGQRKERSSGGEGKEKKKIRPLSRHKVARVLCIIEQA